MSKPQRYPFLTTGIPAAVAAGAAIMAHYGPGGDVVVKADGSPLTEADLASNRVLFEAFSRAGLPILSEEGKEIPYAERKQWERFLLIDPLDGTKEFVNRNGEFTVNIAFIEGNRAVSGIVYAPVPRLLYFADATIGAFRREQDWTEPPAFETVDDWIAGSTRIAPGRNPGGPYRIVGSRSHGSDAFQAFVREKKREHGEVGLVLAGSSLKICMVAEGRADMYPRLGPTMEWDTAAAQAVAECAGARVTDYDTGKPLAYNKRNLTNPFFMVEAGKSSCHPYR